ncbi:MAG: hypothetical protein QY321_04100 [Patescibacteria group bacterium]|nr:MAG: hypothetical protein QY321_04100 [Patescibacteria group bacterium]
MKITAKITLLDGGLAKLETDYGEISCPLEILPKGAVLGQVVYLSLTDKPQETAPEELLKEILKVDN